MAPVESGMKKDNLLATLGAIAVAGLLIFFCLSELAPLLIMLKLLVS